MIDYAYERERQEDLQSYHDGLVDFHRDMAAQDPPTNCVDWCGYRNRFGACTNWQKWPDCELKKQIKP